MVPAGGRSERMGGEEKLCADLGGRPVLQVTLGAVRRAEVFSVVVVVAPRARWAAIAELATREGLPGVMLAEGGDRRQVSVRHGIERCESVTHVCVHDAARPLCPPGLFRKVVAAARTHGAATAAILPVDTIKRVADGNVVETLDRAALAAIQTPQAFERSLLVEAHARAGAEGFEADDDCALVERCGHPVHVVQGDRRNFKVTHPADLLLARALLSAGTADAD